MPQPLRHKRVPYTVSPGEKEGYFVFEFTIGGDIVRGKLQTKLINMALRRTRVRIDQELRDRALGRVNSRATPRRNS